jgi:hypothetical protein
MKGWGGHKGAISLPGQIHRQHEVKMLGHQKGSARLRPGQLDAMQQQPRCQSSKEEN